MTDDQHAYYAAYLRTLAQHFLIGDWDVVLERGRSDDDSRAQVALAHEKSAACVFLNRDFAAYPPEQQRRTVTHELVHVQSARVCRAMHQLAEQFPEHEAIAYARKRLDEEEEIMVDRLARALAPLLPLPPKEDA